MLAGSSAWKKRHLTYVATSTPLFPHPSYPPLVNQKHNTILRHITFLAVVQGAKPVRQILTVHLVPLGLDGFGANGTQPPCPGNAGICHSRRPSLPEQSYIHGYGVGLA